MILRTRLNIHVWTAKDSEKRYCYSIFVRVRTPFLRAPGLVFGFIGSVSADFMEHPTSGLETRAIFAMCKSEKPPRHSPDKIWMFTHKEILGYFGRTNGLCLARSIRCRSAYFMFKPTYGPPSHLQYSSPHRLRSSSGKIWTDRSSLVQMVRALVSDWTGSSGPLLDLSRTGPDRSAKFKRSHRYNALFFTENYGILVELKRTNQLSIARYIISKNWG